MKKTLLFIISIYCIILSWCIWKEDCLSLWTWWVMSWYVYFDTACNGTINCCQFIKDWVIKDYDEIKDDSKINRSYDFKRCTDICSDYISNAYEDLNDSRWNKWWFPESVSKSLDDCFNKCILNGK